jgi:predicted O-methyltransferase YrrM
MRPPTFSGRLASQMASELNGLVQLLQAEGVRSYAEIGAREGDTFHHVMMALPTGSTGVAVDLPGVRWGKDATRVQLERATADLRRQGYHASCVFGDSQAQATQRLVASRGPFDAVLIDGDHTYAGALADWLTYRNQARLVAFHDVAGVGQRCKRSGALVEVPRLWAEIKASGLRTVEFIAPRTTMGIGVAWTR